METGHIATVGSSNKPESNAGGIMSDQREILIQRLVLRGEADVATSHPLLPESGDLDAIDCTPLHHVCVCVRSCGQQCCVYNF